MHLLEATFVVVLTCSHVALKDLSLPEFLNEEAARLQKLGKDCSLQSKLQRKYVDSLRLRLEHDESALCIIKFLKENLKDGVLWAALGTIYDRKGKKFAAQANTCFRQASKVTGKFPDFIQDWNYIGPFVIGKSEFDGDPLEAFGGIYNVSRFRFETGVTYPSELVPHSKVEWVSVKQMTADRTVSVSPNINWNELVNSLGSMGITEWQGWVVGELPVTQNDTTLLLQCQGVSTIHIDGVPVTGDVYHRDGFRFALKLQRGIHLVTIRLRAKVKAAFQCSFQTPPKEGFEILAPSFQPDLYDGYLFSTFLPIAVANYKLEKWLHISKVTVVEQTNGDADLEATVLNKYEVAPGQVQLVTIKLSSRSPMISKLCEPVHLSLVVKTSEGQGNLAVTLRCRKKGESFLFTFLDHDGSVQQAAAIKPLGMCPKDVCATLLTLHGTTVPPQNQADSYKRMVGGKFLFGVDGMWLLAPTRHGAHNWEGPGMLTAMASLEALSTLTHQHEWVEEKADMHHVLFEGHSMGGHGAWHLATHYPDRAIGLAAMAGWIKKEEYGDSNLFFKHDIATSHTDAAVKSIMEACIGENDADRHITNLWGIPVLCRVGAQDRTVHPFFSRRMVRLLNEQGSHVTYSEVKGQEHWWWDTWETNDGGVVNDKQMRAFASKCLSSDSLNAGETCSTESCGMDTEPGKKWWQKPDESWEEVAELVTVNPALGEGLRGVRVLQQVVPFRTSTVKIVITRDEARLWTSNVKRLTLKEPPNRPVRWSQRRVEIDAEDHFAQEDLLQVLTSDTAHFCKMTDHWRVCTDDINSLGERSPLTLGPARRIAEKSFVLIAGTQGDKEITQKLLAFAVYIANLFLLTSDALAPVLRDIDISTAQLHEKNVIILGGPKENKHAQAFIESIPLVVEDTLIRLGSCTFRHPRTSALALAPNGPHGLAMLLMGSSIDGLGDVISLATPTIPPMTRSPFSNLLPDFVILGPEFRRKGPGGSLCMGFWGNRWELRQELISCACGL